MQAVSEGTLDNHQVGTENQGSSRAAPDYSRWIRLCERIRRNDTEALEELYQLFSRGILLYLRRQLGPQDVEDRVHDTFLIVVQAIQRGELRDPERLMGFVRTIVRRQVAAHIESAVHSRRERLDAEISERVYDTKADPEASVIQEEQVQIMKEVLRGVSVRDQEILTRFYIKGETQEQICADLSLSETQFRLLKSRAKARFGELGRRHLATRPLNRLRRTQGGDANSVKLP